MGHVVIGLAFGLVIFSSALLSGLGLGLALLTGWLGCSAGVMAVAGLAALRMTAGRPADAPSGDVLSV